MWDLSRFTRAWPYIGFAGSAIAILFGDRVVAAYFSGVMVGAMAVVLCAQGDKRRFLEDEEGANEP